MKIREGIYVESVGTLEANCFLVAPPNSQLLYIIDPGADADEIVAAAKQLSYVEAVMLFTHAHVDHIAAAGEVAQELGIKRIYLHDGDNKLFYSPNNHLMPYVAAASNLPKTSWPPPENADFSWLHTPGHSKGGVCYFFQKLNALFCGDTIFRGSIGRTDFPGGDQAELMRSIKEVVYSLPDATELFPGHGASTSVGMEKAMNPYVRSDED